MKRRLFIRNGSMVGLAFMGLKSFSQMEPADFKKSTGNPNLGTNNFAFGYGPLNKDSKGILNLPKGFTYKIISKKGDRMSDGFLVPGKADGMATFQGKNDSVIIIRNHEISPNDISNGPFGIENNLIKKLRPGQLYDFGNGKFPCLGGTTTLIYNPKNQKVIQQCLSLAGTIRNCAGGLTPWNSWISCEENTVKADSILEKDHGYNFEVPATSKIKLFDPVPIKSMGRFNHEAVCVDPRTGIVYQTEDRPEGLIYRFIPNKKGQLLKGGRLEVLAISEMDNFDTRNWSDQLGYHMETGKKYSVKWINIDHIHTPDDNLRFQGANLGAAIFARGEGAWFGDQEFYFACTNGGQKSLGQIFRYTPSIYEGLKDESSSPGKLELFVEPNNSKLVESCDNLTIAANGDLIICEDKDTPRIVGITPQGKIYHFALNVGYLSEFAGATFSPDGQTLFVNIQTPGITLAITGPWDSKQNTG